ncbi:hypothetical protein BGX38DRAFT_1203504 [Terfezia claveryi]|nr:hypothetical protein BGX38DRAFT_1203504 [Terfezia claveryi]
MGSDSTAIPRKYQPDTPLSPTTPVEDAASLGFTREVLDSQGEDDSATVFHDSPESISPHDLIPDTPAPSPDFHQFANEALDNTCSSEHDSSTSVVDWDSRSALEGDRFD